MKGPRLVRPGTRLVVYLALFLSMAGFGITIPILPFMARDLGASPLEVSLLVSLFGLTQFLSGPVWGSLSDRFGRKRLMVIGLLGYSVSFFLAGISTTVPALVGSRALGGLLSASVFPCSQALIADLTAPADRGPAMAAMGAWINLGFLFGPVIGGALSPLGYQAPLFIAGVVVVATAILAAAALGPPDQPEFAGAAAVAGAPISSAARPRGWPSPADLKRAMTSPISPYLWLTFAISFAVSGLTALLGYFVIDRLGGTSLDAGSIFTAIGLAGFLTQSLLVGRAMRRFGERRLALVSCVVCALGFLALVPAATLVATGAAAMLIAFASSFLRPSLTAAVSLGTPLPQGLTMGVQSSLDSLGRVGGPVLSGWLYDYGLSLPFWASAGVMVLFGGLAAVRTRPSAGGAITPEASHP